MIKMIRCIPVTVLIFALLACSAFPSGRAEQPPAKAETRTFWILDGSMSPESAEMFLERYLLPTSVAAMWWSEYSVEEGEVRFDSSGGYRIVRKRRVLNEPLGAYTVHAYDLTLQWTADASAPRGKPSSYSIEFSYPRSADSVSGVLPQPLEQALLQAIRRHGLRTGRARVETIKYLGGGRFTATVLVVE